MRREIKLAWDKVLLVTDVFYGKINHLRNLFRNLLLWWAPSRVVQRAFINSRTQTIRFYNKVVISFAWSVKAVNKTCRKNSAIYVTLLLKDAKKDIILIISKFLAQDNDFPAFWLVPMIWAIIVKFDQIRKNRWRISCAEILEIGKIFFAASSVKKMSRFEEVSPEKIKRIAWKFTKTVILLGLAGYELIITELFQLISGASSKNNC